VDLASCTPAVVTCDDTGTATGVWPVVAQVVLGAVLVLAALAVWWVVRSRPLRPVRVPQRRVHVSAAGELVSVAHLPRS
jgi:hypothetical protein